MQKAFKVFIAMVFVSLVLGFVFGNRDVAVDPDVAVDRDVDNHAVVFEGYDPLWQAETIVERRNNRYYLDGDAMEERRHGNMPAEGLSLVLVDRRGEPDNYFPIRDGRMDIYTGCEHGACTLKRTIRQ